MNRKLAAVAAKHGGVFSHQEVLRCGYTVGQVRHRVSDGRWVPLRRGLYAETGDLTALPPWERERVMHRLAVRAVGRALGDTVVISHQSALVMHDLPTWGLSLREVHVTRLDGSTGRLRSGVRHHEGRLLAGEDVVGVDGVRTTSVRRAVVEAACVGRFESAVAFMDAALQRRLVTADDLRDAVRQVHRWPGSGTALAAAAFADGRSESVGESRLRVLIANAGLPAPDLQTEFSTKSGAVVARVDFCFRRERVIVEFDGRIKYVDDAPVVVLREKEREDRLRAAGYVVVRVSWSDLEDPDRVVRRIRNAFHRAQQAGLAPARAVGTG